MDRSSPLGALGIGVLASGSGTILEAILGTDLPVQLVVADRPCRALNVAAEHGVDTELVDRKDYGGFGPQFDRVAYTDGVTGVLQHHGVDVVVMAGFGTVLAEPIHAAYPGRILNTHPALLPAFPGWHAVDDALAAGVAETGTTVHVATVEMDAGPILAQRPSPFCLPTRGQPARADQGGGAHALPRDHPSFPGRAGGRPGPWTRISVGGGRMRALLSVYDKTGVEDLARGLSELGWELVASGGTSAALAAAGIAHVEVADDRGARDARRAGQDPAPPHPRRDPGRPVQARAPGRPGAPGHRAHRPGGVQPLPVLVRPVDRADRRGRTRPWCGPRPRTTPTSGSWS